MAFRGIDIRETGDRIVFRALILDTNSAAVADGTAALYLYELQNDGTVKSYDFDDNTFKTTALTTETLALTHRTGNNSTTNTGLWSAILATLTGFTAGNIYIVTIIHSAEGQQSREFQFGSGVLADVKEVAGSAVTGVNDFKADVSGVSTFDPSSDEVDIGAVKGVAVISVDDFKADVSQVSTFDPAADEVDIGKVKGVAVTNVDDFKANVSDLSKAEKLLAYIQLLARKDLAIATDNATELAEINANGGSGVGAYSNQTDAQEAIRDIVATDADMNMAIDDIGAVAMDVGDIAGVLGDVESAIATAQGDLDILTGEDGAILATTQTNYAPASASKLLKFIQLLSRKDATIATDNATELTEINANGGAFDNTRESHEAIRDQGDQAWLTGSGASATKSYTTTSWTRVVGDDDGGVPADTAAVDGVLFSTGELNSGTYLEVSAVFPIADGEIAESVDIWGFYDGGGSHFIQVLALDIISGDYEPVGQISQTPAVVQKYSFSLSPNHTDATLNQVTIKFLHGGGTGNASHVFSVDKGQVDTLVIAPTDVTIADGAIKKTTFDNTTAFAVESADAATTKIARTGADSDTLESISDQIDVAQLDLDNPDQYKADVSGLSTFDAATDEVDIGKVKGVAVTGVNDFKANVSGLSTFDASTDEVTLAADQEVNVTKVNGNALINGATLAALLKDLHVEAVGDTIDTDVVAGTSTYLDADGNEHMTITINTVTNNRTKV